MKIPKILSKYEGYINSLNNRVNRNSSESLSSFLLNQILNSKDGKLVLKMKVGSDKFQFYIPDEEDIPNCFLKRIWNFATIEDKIKITDKYLDYLFRNDIQSRPTLRIVSHPNSTVDNDSLASYEKKNNEIFLNLDNLEDVSGLNFMAILFHECTHAKDMANIEKNIAPEILTKYTRISDEEANYAKLWEKLIIDMPFEGLVFNKKLGDKELLESVPQQKILKCKNYFSIFNECTMYSPDNIRNKKDFETYLNSILYFYSPLERFARISVRNFFMKQLTDKRIIMDEDIKEARAIIDGEDKIDECIATFKEFLAKPSQYGGQETIVDMKGLFDLASKYNFYCKRGFGKFTNEIKYPTQAKKIKEEYNKTLSQLYHNFMLKEKDKER